MNWNALFLSSKGRMSRQTFWVCAGMLIAASLVAGLVPIIGTLIAMALTWPWLMVLTKRLHDLNRSGALAWAMLIPNVIASGLMLLVGLVAMNPAMAMLALPLAGVVGVVGMVAGLISLAFLIWLAVKAGDAHANTYGPEPTDLAFGQA